MAGMQFNISDREMHSLDKDRDYMNHWKRERVTYCDPGRVLPPNRPDTNVASVSWEVQVITIE